MEDFGLTFIFLAIAAIFGIIYLFKITKSKQLFAKAMDAKTQGDDRLAVSLFKQALNMANEQPDKEMDILSNLKELYGKHNLEYDFTDYETLISQFRTLKSKSSNKAIREMGKVNKLKQGLIERMPELP